MRALTIIRMGALGIFFFSVVWFVLSAPDALFNSPDESGNAFFASLYSQTGAMRFPLSMSGDWVDLLHPRSMLVVEGTIVPGSFLGLPWIAGTVAQVLGFHFALLLTPLLAILGVMCWRKIVLELFKNERLADLAAFFLLFHPAFWYYTGRSMMHNVGFLCLLIMAFFFLVCQPWHHWKGKVFRFPYLDEIFAGGLLSLSLAFRTSEFLWVGTLVVAFLIWKRKDVSLGRLGVFVASVALFVLPVCAMNNQLYGSPWSTAYTVHEENTAPLQDVGGLSEEGGSSFFSMLFPFGIHEMNILRSVWRYGFLLYPWMSACALLGCVVTWKKKAWRPWLMVTGLLGLWLALVYGSWSFHDNPDADAITLGNSYVRYWLPVFTLASALAGAGVEWIGQQCAKHPFASKASVPVILLVVALLSGGLVFFGTDGFAQTLTNIDSFSQKRDAILQATEQQSIIVADMADKYLFPDRLVMTPLRSQDVYAAIPEALEQTTVYYFGITLPQEDIDYLEDVVFAQTPLTIVERFTLVDESLYQFVMEP